jgi:serine/threonine protein kinase
MVADLETGATLGPYRLGTLLGRGGMGTVWQASRADGGADVALKVIAPEHATDIRFRARFEREARLAAQIDHPHAVRVLDHGEDAGFPYLAIQFVDGVDLAGLLAQRGALPAAHAAEIAAQVASALAATAALGLLHRDVKPSNVLLVRGPAVHAMLTDFGLSRHVSSQSGLTMTGQWLGSVDYVSPEQIDCGEVDHRTDVYGLGCLLFEALTGLVPFPRPRETERLLAHLTDAPPSPSAHGAPPCFDPIVAKALAKRPADRYATAAELEVALRTAAAGCGAPGEPLVPAHAPAAEPVGRNDATIA